MATVYVPKGTTDLTAYGADTDTLILAEGSQTISAGLNKTALTEGFAKIVVAETFTGVIGGAGGPLRCDVDSGSGLFQYHAGGGACYYRPEGDDNLCDELEIISGGTFYLVSGGTVTECGLARGRLVCPDAVVMTNLRQSGGSSDFGYNATGFTGLWVGGGQLNSGRGFSGTAFLSDSQAIFKREDTSATVGTGGTLNIVGPGYYKWCLGNLTTVNLAHPRAILDLSEAPANLTITNLLGYGQAIAKSRLASKLATVTITNTTVYGGSADYWKNFGTGGGSGFGLTG